MRKLPSTAASLNEWGSWLHGLQGSIQLVHFFILDCKQVNKTVPFETLCRET